MSTTYAPPTHARRLHVNPWVVATAVLALALAGLGAWVLVDRSSSDGGSTQDATTLIDDVNTGWNAGDANAVAAVYAQNAVIRSLGDTVVGSKAIGRAAAIASASGLHVERVAPVTLDGPFASTFVKITGVGIDRAPVLTVWQLQDGKILRQWGFGIGTTRPFDNALMP